MNEEDSDLDYLDTDFDEVEDATPDEDAYSAGRLITVALSGALLSLGVYYLYQQLEPEKKSRLKKKASGMIQEQIHAWTEIREP